MTNIKRDYIFYGAVYKGIFEQTSLTIKGVFDAKLFATNPTEDNLREIYKKLTAQYNRMIDLLSGKSLNHEEREDVSWLAGKLNMLKENFASSMISRNINVKCKEGELIV